MALFTWYNNNNTCGQNTPAAAAAACSTPSTSQAPHPENTPMMAEMNSQERSEAEEVTVYDSNGDGLIVRREDGGLWPRTMMSPNKVRGFSARSDDVFLCTYSRSGTHWIWELLEMLINNQLSVQEVSKMDAMLEFAGCDRLETIPSPRVINTHLNYDQIPPDVFRKRCKIVFGCRNPKDVAVSYYNFIKSRQHFEYNGKFAAFLGLFIEGKVPYGSWFEHIQGWDRALHTDTRGQIFILYYEQLKQNFVPTISSLCTFLGVSRPLEFLEEMEKLSSFEKFKLRVDGRLNEASRAQWKDGPQIIRKGIVGDWKNWFTVAKSEQFDAVCQQKLDGSSFEFCFEGDAVLN